jgi:hypothetical protein
MTWYCRCGWDNTGPVCWKCGRLRPEEVGNRNSGDEEEDHAIVFVHVLNVGFAAMTACESGSK